MRHRDAVVGIRGGLLETVDLRGHAVGDGLTGGIVLGGIDLAARGQALDGAVERLLRGVQIALGRQRKRIGVDDE